MGRLPTAPPSPPGRHYLRDALVGSQAPVGQALMGRAPFLRAEDPITRGQGIPLKVVNQFEVIEVEDGHACPVSLPHQSAQTLQGLPDRIGLQVEYRPQGRLAQRLATGGGQQAAQDGFHLCPPAGVLFEPSEGWGENILRVGDDGLEQGRHIGVGQPLHLPHHHVQVKGIAVQGRVQLLLLGGRERHAPLGQQGGLKLANREGIRRLAFDLDARTLVVTHTGDSAAIEQALRELNLGASLAGRARLAEDEVDLDATDAQQRRLLIIVLVINAALFALEFATGFLANSMGLVADSLDMLADALVYGLSLYAVGKAVAQKKRVARISGYFQLLLAIFGIVEVLRRFLGGGDEANFILMIVISLVALVGNVASLIILRRTQSQDANIKASQIFTSNDVLVNIGVIVAGALIFVTGSNLPDLIVGAVVFFLVASGALRILQLSR